MQTLSHSPPARKLTAADFVSRLGPDAKPAQTAHGWQCRCPAHKDKTPSLSVTEGDAGQVLIHCFAGCKPDAIVAAVGLKLADLMPANGNAWRPAPPRKAATPTAFDWRKCVAAFTDADALKLAKWRGFSLDFVRWLHSRGFAGLHDGKVAFPNHDGNKVVSCHVRLESGKWIFQPKGQRTAPLVFGDVATAGFVLAFESQWDAFASMDKLGWHAGDGLPDSAVFVTRGAANGKLAQGHFAPDVICYAFEQNEPPAPGKEISPAQQWTADLAAAAGCKVLRVATPAQFKDANDWTKAGATESEIRAAMLASKPVHVNPPPDCDETPFEELPTSPAPEDEAEPPPPIEGRPLSALIRHDGNDPGELLLFRFLCRLAILLLCGPTGIGKSSLAMQFMLLWALAKEAFGIRPARPLKSLLIQGENDDGDLAEMRDGVIAGLKLTPAEAKQATENVIVWREDSRTALRFFWEVVRPLLEAHRPDLLWIDPALCYLGGETGSQKDVGAFLRNQLNPLLREFNCGAVVIHHTNKPPSGREKPDWQAGDFAYLGSGSAEWANTARAVLALRSIGSHEVFELRAGKRGSRLGWQEPDGSKSFVRYLAHATEPGVICWREVSAADLDKGGRPASHDADDLLALLPREGLTTTEWQTKADTESGISRRSFFRLRKALEQQKRVTKSVTDERWQPLRKAS